MNTVQAYIRETEKYGDDVYAAKIMKIVVGDESNDFQRTVENNIRVGIGTQGYLSFTDEGTSNQVFFYSDQLEDLKKIVDKAITVRDAHAKNFENDSL